MHRRSALRTVGALGVGSLPLLAGCLGGDDTPDDTATDTSIVEGIRPTLAMNPRESNTVMMYTTYRDAFFDPIGLFVEPGETVTWNIGTGTHTSTSYKEGYARSEVTRIPEGAQGWHSPQMSTGMGPKAFSRTFDVPGTYDYYCNPHKPFMVGRLVVGEPGGPAEGSMPPDDPVPESEVFVAEGAVRYESFQQDSQ